MMGQATGLNPYLSHAETDQTAADTKYGGKFPKVLPAIRNDNSAGGNSSHHIGDMNNTMVEFGSIRQSHTNGALDQSIMSAKQIYH